MEDEALLTSTLAFYYVSAFAISGAAFLSYKICAPGITLDKSCVKINKVWYAVSFVIAVLITGFAANGVDYPVYADIFTTSNDIPFTLSYYRIEPGFVLLNFVVRLFTADYKVFFFIMSFLTALFVYAAVYRMRDVLHAGWAILAFSTAFYFQQMDLKRIYLAAAIVLFGMPYVVKRQYLRAIIVIAIATSLHTSAAIMLVPVFYEMFMEKILYRRWVVFAAVVMILLVYFLRNWLFSTPFSSRYVNYHVEDSGFGIIQPIFHIPILVVLYFFWVPKEFDEYRNVAFVLTLASFVLGMIAYFFPITGRMFVFFMFPFMLAPSLCYDRFRPGRNLHVSFYTVMHILFFLYFCFRLYMMMYSFAYPDDLMPYRTIFGLTI